MGQNVVPFITALPSSCNVSCELVDVVADTTGRRRSSASFIPSVDVFCEGRGSFFFEGEGKKEDVARRPRAIAYLQGLQSR